MMKISIKGAKVHNLKNIDAVFSDGLTAVTGISGSGKTSLVFDTLYSEARRRFLSVFSSSFQAENLTPANVDSISGLCPVTALKQNRVNRNPNSILATASGIHPFLRLLFSHFGIQSCPECHSESSILSKDAIIHEIMNLAAAGDIKIFAPLVINITGSHQTLLNFLVKEFPADQIYVDGKIYSGGIIDYTEPHHIFLKLPVPKTAVNSTEAKKMIEAAASLGISSLMIESGEHRQSYTFKPVCLTCGASIKKPEPKFFHFPCPYCNKSGCVKCSGTGIHPAAAHVKWHDYRITDFLKLSVDEAYTFFVNNTLPDEAKRLQKEIIERLEMLCKVGLGYITLDRPSPTLSRGESQRLRLAVALTSRLEDLVHILDEPTIGLHPSDVLKLMPALRELGGPVIFIEHDNLAVNQADYVMDLGPGAGINGGELLYAGTPSGLWQEESASGRFFSCRDRPDYFANPEASEKFIEITGANSHNLKNIDFKIPLTRLSVITGVSGSGKSTLIEEVLIASFHKGNATGCKNFILPQGCKLKPVYVDQNPIGINSRSNPATYTGLANVIRDVFASLSGTHKSHFSFNTKAGACPECGGTGEIEVQMRYLPSSWIACSACGGKRFSGEIDEIKIELDHREFTIADFYELSIDEAINLFEKTNGINASKRKSALKILYSLHDTGVGYLKLGQSSPSLSGGEAQRIKLAKYLAKGNLTEDLLILDEPTTGLHPANVKDLLSVFHKLIKANATIVIVEHNIDIMQSADWIIDLGPGAGPEGGEVIYQGDPTGFLNTAGSVTADMIRNVQLIKPVNPEKSPEKSGSFSGETSIHLKKAADRYIVIKNARANNLKNINVRIPKAKLTVVTGISGSGKSSLVHDILENEAKHLYFESLSVYERYNTREKSEIMADSVRGLGITMSIGAKQKPRDVRLSLRSTVGTASEIAYHLGVLFSLSGSRNCLKCGLPLQRGNRWFCPSCGYQDKIGEPYHFLGFSYVSACLHCHGVGTVTLPNPDKLIVHPEKPLCSGAMYSPGFFPQGYLCKPYNGGYDIVMAFAEKYSFDPFTLPWKEMKEEVRQIFLFGDTQLKVTYESKTGKKRTVDQLFHGFYGTWLRNWDVFGTYTDIVDCPECKGSKLKAAYHAVTLGGMNIHALNQMSLKRLKIFLEPLSEQLNRDRIVLSSYEIIIKRIEFLLKTGLDYVSLDRLSSTLSAGEAQRVKLAALLGSELNSMTVLLDEPTRGLHPGEIAALINCLKALTEKNNTVIVVEHDPLVINNADYMIDIGPGSGANGGRIVYEGPPEEIGKTGTTTGIWLKEAPDIQIIKKAALPEKWFILKGATENNLKISEIKIPYGLLTGICGVSGSGKSTLLIDTIGRILSPKKHTTSVSNEPLKPGKYAEIINCPERTVIIDQVIAGITNPADYLGLTPLIEKHYAASEERQITGIDPGLFKKCCSACKGRGWIKMNMSFLPDVYNACPICSGTGYPEEIRSVMLNGYSLPEIFSLTLDEVYKQFETSGVIRKKLDVALKTGLGYLVLKQHSHALSGGEVQRLKIARELCDKQPADTFYLLDEPTVGLHFADVSKLIAVMRELVNAGHTVIVIEHHPHLLSACDYLIELGPGGGEEGGKIIYQGTVEAMKRANTPTALFLQGGKGEAL